MYNNIRSSKESSVSENIFKGKLYGLSSDEEINKLYGINIISDKVYNIDMDRVYGKESDEEDYDEDELDEDDFRFRMEIIPYLIHFSVCYDINISDTVNIYLYTKDMIEFNNVKYIINKISNKQIPPDNLFSSISFKTKSTWNVNRIRSCTPIYYHTVIHAHGFTDHIKFDNVKNSANISFISAFPDENEYLLGFDKYHLVNCDMDIGKRSYKTYDPTISFGKDVTCFKTKEMESVLKSSIPYAITDFETDDFMKNPLFSAFFRTFGSKFITLTIDRLIEQGENVALNFLVGETRNGDTILSLAIRYYKLNIVRLIASYLKRLDKKYLDNWRDIDGRSYALLLIYTVQNVDYIYDNFNDIFSLFDNIVDNYGRTWVHYNAGNMGYNKELTSYVDVPYKLTLKQDIYGNTPIMHQLTTIKPYKLYNGKEIKLRFPSLDKLINKDSVNIPNILNQIPATVNQYSVYNDRILSLTNNINHMDNLYMTPLLNLLYEQGRNIPNQHYIVTIDDLLKYNFDLTLSKSLSPFVISYMLNNKGVVMYIATQIGHMNSTEMEIVNSSIHPTIKEVSYIFDRVINSFTPRSE